MSEVQTIPGKITKKEALQGLLDLRKKIDIMAASIIESPSDEFEAQEIKNVLYNFFHNG